MANEHNIKIFTAADIEKYHKGLMSSKERHALEKAALDDPFLADALEGYSAVAVNVNEDIAELKKMLSGRTEKSKSIKIPLPFSLWKVAAMIVLVAGAGLLVYQLGFNNKQAEIAQVNKKTPANAETIKQAIPVADSLKSLDIDSLSKDVAVQQREKELGFKKTEQSSALASPNRTTENVPAESNAVKEKDLAKGLVKTTVPGTATAPAKADDKPNETKKSLRNDNAFDKNIAAEKSPDFKKKELSVKRKVDADADGDLDRLEGNVATKPSANNAIRKQQGFYQPNQTNVFRGRVTDANNNALPFSNITNTQDGIGTYSDAQGNFTLTSPDSIMDVRVSSLGFETNNIKLQNTVPNNQVFLQEDRSSLAEVVISSKKVNSNRSRNANMVLKEPEPADGWSNYDIYLANNLKVPETFKDKQTGTGGEVELSFEINKNGEPFNITVKRSLCETCDKEAIRLIKEGPKWTRKAKKGRASVTVPF